MANEQNLIHKDFSKMPGFKERSALGGSRSTHKKKWAARLRELKKKGLSDENYRKIYAIMTEKESFAMDNYLKMQKWLEECTDVKEKILLGRLLNDLMGKLHGENVKTENVHHVIDWTKILSDCVVSEENKEDEE